MLVPIGEGGCFNCSSFVYLSTCDKPKLWTHLNLTKSTYRLLRALLGNSSYDDSNGKEKKKKRNRFWQITTVHVQHALLYISFPSLHDYSVEVPNFTVCRGSEHKTTTFFFFSWSPLEFNPKQSYNRHRRCMLLKLPIISRSGAGP